MISKSVKDTEKIAKIFLEKLLKDKNKDTALVVALSGDLGVGKTAFTQSVLKHLGVKNKVSSPTFVIIKKYSLKTKGYKYLFHLDAYRLKNKQELLNLGWEEIIEDGENLVFIEWPENVTKAIPANAKFIRIKDMDGGNKSFEF